MNLIEEFVTPDDADIEGASDAGRVKPFTIWKPSQFVGYTAPIDSIILEHGLVERGKWTSVIGIGGLGKTRLLLLLSIQQITGREWCGLKTHGKPLRWLVLSTENGLRRWKSDLTAMLAELSEEQRSAIDEHLSIMAMVDDEDADLNTGSLESMARLAVTLREFKPDAIVFDPFADMIDGDENKTEHIVATLRTLRQIVRREVPAAAVVIIHHARTGAGNVAQAGDNFSAGNFGRGAKALYSAVRAEIQLAPGDRDDGNKIVVACGKNSDGPKFSPRGIIFDPESCSYTVDPSFDLDAWRADVSGQRSQAAVTIADVVEAVQKLAAKPGDETTTKQVFEFLEETGAPLRTVQRQLRNGADAGYLRDGKKRGAWRLGAKPLTQ